MPLPQAIRSRVPPRLRDHPALRAAALGAGLIPPRSLHTPGEAALLRRLASAATCVVEIGVYEGSSAAELCEALPNGAELHLIDPFVDPGGWSLREGWRAMPAITRRVVERRSRRSGPELRWHIARSQDVGRAWDGPAVDLVFIDGDHSPQGCREDWDVWHRHVRDGGAIAFHDARLGVAGGEGQTGPTSVVEELFRSPQPVAGWRITEEVDTTVVVRRAAA